MKTTSEAAFETAIEASLQACGYVRHFSKDFDPELAIFPAVALQFIRSTQGKLWEKLEALHGEHTGERIISALCKWMDAHGVLATLRHGFKCYGKTLRIAFFKPAHGLNPDLEARYGKNILSITRQLHFSAKRPKDSLDVTLSVNGIPLVTLELKNPLSGQTAANAIRQYRHDRDHREKIFDFKKRTLVHFAVDTEEVHMTTRLAGAATHFLPFNKGRDGGAGNPPDPAGRNYRTAYLWEDVLERHSLLELLARFLHLQIEDKRTDDGRKVKKESMIFPRFHQRNTVCELVGAASVDGPGHNYLVEQSAGSGKSNTIAWLAHRLSNLHNAADERVFDSVIVVTDRVVLDRQLQDTIYQFDHRQGVVEKIEENSRQLAEALENAVPIIITTLQKFPFVTQQLLKMAEERGDERNHLPTRKCAVIIDEAHSSQSGETATDLKEVLGGEALRKKAKELAEEEGGVDLEKLYRSVAKRGQQPNLSFFAFTATPKGKTLELFGRKGASGMPEAFHLYSMRQAIEEGFILDVVKNYTTYATYYRLVKAIENDPNLPKKKAARALAKFMSLHPHNIEQKTEVMVEHFRQKVQGHLGGRAKAMVVTSSRLHAVRYMKAFERYLAENKITDIRPLVAFSGTVRDPETGLEYTEPGMNVDCVSGKGISEKQLPERFASPDYQVLLVANKYQTGFDQPLLCAMYVDKRLDGVQAVQTLSRLNRKIPGKENPFVLDFVNEAEDIYKAFKPYYDATSLQEGSDPQRLEEIKHELDAFQVYYWSEVEAFSRVFYKPVSRQTAQDHAGMQLHLQPAVDRFKALEDDAARSEFREKLSGFVNLYAFMSQIMPYADPALEMLYSYGRFLLPHLPLDRDLEQVKIGDEVGLHYYRLQRIYAGEISLREGEPEGVKSPTDVGTGRAKEERVPLSEIIKVLNDRFGTSFSEEDRFFFEQIREKAVNDEQVIKLRRANPFDKFQLGLRQLIEDLMVARMDDNDKIVTRYMDDKDFGSTAFSVLSKAIYESIPTAESPQAG